MYKMDSTLDIKRGGRKVGNYQRMKIIISNTGMRNTLTCKNGSKRSFFGRFTRCA